MSTVQGNTSAAGADRAESRAAAALSPTAVVMLAFLAVAFGSLFFRWFLRQGQHSINKLEDWGHAFVIPLISVYLIWQIRDKVKAAPIRVFWPALAPFLLGIMAYFFSLVGIKNHMLQGFSMILTLSAAILLIAGPRLFGLLFIPLAYLGFAVTLSEQIMLQITFQLQLIASKGSWVFLNVVGVFMDFATDRDGNTLTIIKKTGETIPLNVAEACSGMRMVVAFYALGVAVALVSCKFWWQRIALILLAGPVAVFMNIIRVSVLGLASLSDPELAAGDAHTLIGTVLLIPSLLLFMAVVWALNKIVEEPGAKKIDPRSISRGKRSTSGGAPRGES